MFFVMSWTRCCRYSHIVCVVNKCPKRADILQYSQELPLTRPELKFRANSPSPLKWTEIISKQAHSPLKRTWAMSQGLKSLAVGNLTKHLPQLRQMGVFQHYDYSNRSRRDRE